MITGIVFDIRKFSIHDGPGIRTTVFFKGCPLSCWWCHNPESQARKPELVFRASRCIRCEACRLVCASGAISWPASAYLHLGRRHRCAAARLGSRQWAEGAGRSLSQGDEGKVRGWDGDFPATDGEKCKLCGACVEACYTEAREVVGRVMTVGQVMAEIEKDTAFYDESGGGATFSGGEPLLQRDFLLALLQACQERGIHTAVDTCGFATWETLDSIRGYVDLFLYDLKLIDDDSHQRFTGVSNELILRNLQLLSAQGHNIFLRVPIIPGINDADEDIRQVGAFVAALPQPNSAAEPAQVVLLPYHHAGVEKYDRLGKVYGLPETGPPLDERMGEIARILRGFGLRVRIGG